MSQIIKCPRCEGRDWSSDYWYCPHCNYYVGKEETLLEENKDYLDGGNQGQKGRGDEPSILLNTWIESQKELTREMVDKCLPKSKGYNWKVNFPSNVSWIGGETEYHENDPQEAKLFISRHEKELIEKGHWQMEIFPNGQIIKVPRYPNYSGSYCCPCPKPTKIIISKRTLTYEGSYGLNKIGYFSTIPHESAHASPEVKRHPKFEPFSSKYIRGPGHDDIHNDKNREFYQKLESNQYIEKVKKRFKEYRKIQGKDENKYND